MLKRYRNTIIGGVLSSLWPSVIWYGKHLGTEGHTVLMGMPLLLAILVAIHEGRANRGAPVARTGLLLGALLLTAHAATLHATPPIVSALIALAAVTACFSGLFLGRAFHHGIAALLMLSLPVAASLNFYAGFPLRVCSARVAVAMMMPTGIIPDIVGTCLKWNDQLVFIDAPCGGVRMLWTAGVLTALLICWFRLRLMRSLCLGMVALLAVVVGNGCRTASLFFLETESLPVPETHHVLLHNGAGLIIFAACAIAILIVAIRISRNQKPAAHLAPHRSRNPLDAAVIVLLLLAAALSAGMPYMAQPQKTLQTAAFPGWPATFETHSLRPLPPDETDTRFGADFPGKTGRFSCGNSTCVIRWVDRPTRALHRPAVCFEAIGYQLDYTPMHVDARGTQWSCFDASRDGNTLRVRTQIVDSEGNTWPDASSWYWAATSGCSTGPWWAFTIATPSTP